MSALSIQVPFPVFNDRDGQPLDNGYVLIGVPNLPPQTNPVNVYFDEALTILAPQPLRTINGYISNAGTPAQVYIDGVNFSILVQDSKGSLVYSFAEGTGINADASGITYDPPFSGSVPTNVEAKLAQTVSVKDFGAVGDGVTDDTAAFRNALGTYSEVRQVFVPVGTYKISGTLSLGIRKKLFGEHSSAATLNYVGVDTIFIQGDAFSHLEGLRLVNVGATPLTTAVASYTPTTANGWRNGVVRDVEIVDFHYGIGSTQGLVQGLMFQNVYERVRVYDASRAVYMGAGSNANTWINCEFWNCAYALQLNNATSQVFISCGFEGSTLYDFDVNTCNNVTFDTCYFEPARGGLFTDSTGTFVDCHSTNFASASTVFLTAITNSTVYMHDFTDYNSGGGVVTGQRYYSTDGTGTVYGLNLTTRGGGQKITPSSTDGVIRSITRTGDWIITRYGNGLMTADFGTNVSTDTLIMTGATTSYSATVTIPSSFLDNNFVAQAGIAFNSNASFLLTDNPTIAALPATANTVHVRAQRTGTTGSDGYFHTIRCVGLWK